MGWPGPRAASLRQAEAEAMSSVDRTGPHAPLAPLQPVRRVRRPGEKHADCDADARRRNSKTRNICDERDPDEPGHLVDELV